MNEEWKTIPYALNYDVSNCGNVRQNKKNKLLKPYISKQNGYAYIYIRDNNGKYLNKRIHRLVAETFIPNPLNKCDVNHKDFNRSNNCVNNLEWVTRSENNLWSSERISKSAKRKTISQETRNKFSQRQISKSKNPYPTYVYKTKTGYIFRIIRQGSNIVSKQFKTLEQVLAFKDNWEKEKNNESNINEH
ncbi:MAG: HNH endonuclease [Methanobrevibacter sp.]|nr:HNH endonuclease [Methanobrevibacter sp.]